MKNNKTGLRELAYVVSIDKIEPIDKADKIELVTVNGWKVICKKDEYKVGDLAVYFEVDSLVPSDKECFSFLANRGYKIKTQKMRGVYSQGLVMSFEDLGLDKNKYKKGDFLTEELGVKNYQDITLGQKGVKTPQSMKDKQKTERIFNSWYGKILRKTEWGKKILLKMCPSQPNRMGWPSGVFPGVSKTDQERCLFPTTKILTDKGQIQISKIVNSKLDVKVLSVNINTGLCEWKDITGYQKIKTSKDEYMTIEYKALNNRSNGTCHTASTLDHKYFIKDKGYIEAKDLKVGDVLLYQTKSFTNEVLPVLYGMLLGDGSIKRDNRSENNRITFQTCHSIKQNDYLNFIKQMFDEEDFCFGNAGKGTFGKEDCYNFILKCDDFIDEKLREHWNREGKKVITKEMCEILNESSLAFWYMDDGNLSNRNGKNQRPSIRLNTQGFSLEENNLLVDTLNNKFGIKCNLRSDKGKYYLIYITAESTPRFLQMITPYMCKSMAYKTLPEYEKNLESKIFKFKKQNSFISNPIISITQGQYFKRQTSYSYDITVKDNHNFFANGVLTHNCENMPYILNENKHWIVTEKCDGSSATYILAKKLIGYEFYVCSRNVRQETPNAKTYFEDIKGNVYWEMADKYHIEEKLKDYLKQTGNKFVCVQGEICGPGIQKNPHGLKNHHLFCFHMTDEKNGRFDIREAIKWWHSFGFEHVPVIEEYATLDSELEFFKQHADGFYDPCVCEGKKNQKREGLVYYNVEDPTESFKNVSRKYLLKHS